MSGNNIVELEIELWCSSPELVLDNSGDKTDYELTATIHRFSQSGEVFSSQMNLQLSKHSLELICDSYEKQEVLNMGLGKFINGVGIPPGGNVGEVLVKSSNNNYDTKWVSGIYGGDKNFYFFQLTPIKVWEINHYLNKFPSVTIFDSSGAVVMGDINYINLNSITITFADAFSGKATLN